MTEDQLKQTYLEFFKMFNWQSVEVVDPTNRNQCFDLAVAFCLDLGLPITIFAGLLHARQIWTNPTPLSKEKFDFIPNTATFIPKMGDICVFGNGVSGHVSMANGVGNLGTFQSFDQNWSPAQQVSQIINHDYDRDNLLGVLRFKTTPAVVTPPVGDNIKRKSGFFDKWYQAYYGTNIDTDKVTDKQAEDRRRWSIQERDRAGIMDRTVLYLFDLKLKDEQGNLIIPTQDSNKISFDQIKKAMDKLKAGAVDTEKIKKDAYNQAIADGNVALTKLIKN